MAFGMGGRDRGDQDRLLCGKAARFNARFNENGIIREGDQVFLAGNDSYIALCRKHHREGNLGPNFKK